MKTKLSIIVWALCCLQTAIAETPAGKEAFASELTTKSRTIETISCDFTETRHMNVLAKDAVRDGKFSYKRPSRMLLAFDAGDKILMTEEKFEMLTDGRTVSAKMNSNPMLRQMQAIFGACMTGDVEQLLGGGEMQITSTDRGYLVRLTPSARSARKYVSAIVLTFDRSDMTLDELRMEQPSGDYTLYRFRNKRLNILVEDTLFRLK